MATGGQDDGINGRRMAARMDEAAAGPATTFKQTLYTVARPAFDELARHSNHHNPEVEGQIWIKHSPHFTSGPGQAALHGARDAVKLLPQQLATTAEALPDTVLRDSLLDRASRSRRHSRRAHSA